MAVIVLVVICGLLMKVVSCDCPGVSIYPMKDGATNLTRDKTICGLHCFIKLYNSDGDEVSGDLFGINLKPNGENRLIMLNISLTSSGDLENYYFGTLAAGRMEIYFGSLCANVALPILPQFLGNGTANYTFTDKGTAVLFTCDFGYTLERNESIAFIISSDNVTYSWNGTPHLKCVAPSDSSPPAGNDTGTVGTTCTIGCILGTIFGTTAFTCIIGIGIRIGLVAFYCKKNPSGSQDRSGSDRPDKKGSQDGGGSKQPDKKDTDSKVEMGGDSAGGTQVELDIGKTELSEQKCQVRVIKATSDTTNTNLRRRVTRVHEKKGDSTIEDVKGLKDTQLDTKVMEHGPSPPEAGTDGGDVKDSDEKKPRIDALPVTGMRPRRPLPPPPQLLVDERASYQSKRSPPSKAQEDQSGAIAPEAQTDGDAIPPPKAAIVPEAETDEGTDVNLQLSGDGIETDTDHRSKASQEKELDTGKTDPSAQKPKVETSEALALPPRWGLWNFHKDIEDLKKKTGVTDAQLDTKVMEHVFPWWLYKDLQIFFDSLGLAIDKKLGRRSAMKKALEMWSRDDSSAATYRALVGITLNLDLDLGITLNLDLDLGQFCLAHDLCQYIKAKVPVSMDKLVAPVDEKSYESKETGTDGSDIKQSNEKDGNYACTLLSQHPTKDKDRCTHPFCCIFGALMKPPTKPYVHEKKDDFAIEDLKKNTGVRDAQLDTKVMEHDVGIIATIFSEPWINFHYPQPMFGFQQSLMKTALKMLREHDPSAATYRALVRLTLDVRHFEVAHDLCHYIKEQVPAAMEKQGVRQETEESACGISETTVPPPQVNV